MSRGPIFSALAICAALVATDADAVNAGSGQAGGDKAAISKHWTAPFDCPLAKAGWRAERFEGRARNQVVCEDGGLRILSNNSVSLHHIAPPRGLSAARRLSWEWRVEQSGGSADLTRKGQDDRNIAVLVAFRYDPEHASLQERLLRPLIEARRGADAPGRVLAYTWAGPRVRSERRERRAATETTSGRDMGKAPPMLRSPFGGAAHRIIVLQRGAGDWRGESVDLANDYRRAFGDEGYEIQSIAIAADTDDQGGAAHAAIRALRLERP